MTLLSKIILSHLPSLRSFSRTVCNSKQIGDTLIEAMLEALIDDLTLYQEASTEKVAVFKLYTRIYHLAYDSLDGVDVEIHAGNSHIPQCHWKKILVELEGFTSEEADEIGEVTAALQPKLRKIAQSEISLMAK